MRKAGASSTRSGFFVSPSTAFHEPPTRTAFLLCALHRPSACQVLHSLAGGWCRQPDRPLAQQRQRLVVLPAIENRCRQRLIESNRPDRMAVGAAQRVPADGLDPTGPVAQKAPLRPAIVL